jgi:hypothetical protein
MEILLELKIASVRTKISALRKLERELTGAMMRCQANLRKRNGKVEACPCPKRHLAEEGKKRP